MEILIADSKIESELIAAEKFIAKFTPFIKMAESKIEEFANNINIIK